jgi:hypothetical protein
MPAPPPQRETAAAPPEKRAELRPASVKIFCDSFAELPLGDKRKARTEESRRSTDKIAGQDLAHLPHLEAPHAGFFHIEAPLSIFSIRHIHASNFQRAQRCAFMASLSDFRYVYTALSPPALSPPFVSPRPNRKKRISPHICIRSQIMQCLVSNYGGGYFNSAARSDRGGQLRPARGEEGRQKPLAWVSIWRYQSS